MILTQEEFKNIFDNYFEHLRKYLFYRSGNDELATDIAQDTFMRIWEKQVEIDPKKVKGLLFKIGNDLFISHYRKDQVAFKFFKTYKPDEHDLSPEEQLNFNELKIAYEKSLETMPEKQRVVFLMSRIDELKYAEIAKLLELSVKAVEKRMNLALIHLKTHLKDKITGIILFLLGHCLSKHQNKICSETTK
jgi:RNA polymerase sigma factor (sigma-70 family)